VELGDSVRRQLDGLDLAGDKPLIICDVDEVVVHFIQSLEAHLEANGCWLEPSSFALNGNVRHKHNDEPVSGTKLGELLFGCFDARTRVMDAIDGAVDALLELGRHTEIVMLTNLPEDYLDDMVENLRGHGLTYPVVANSGHKGPAVKVLTDDLAHAAVFIDDSPNNIKSVGEWCPETHLIHFLPDQRFARHVPPMDGVALRTDNWTDARDYISTLVGSSGAPEGP